MPIPDDSALTVFGAEAGSYVPLVDRCVATLDGYRYEFSPHPDFQTALVTDIRQGMQIYWKEILYRAHWAASTSLIRSQRWIAGILQMHDVGNVLAFSACCRGLLEAAADTNDALNPIPATLASNHATARSALAGHLEVPILGEEIENRLLHFTHATKPKKGEELAHEQHLAKTAAKYLKRFEQEDPRVKDCYAILCDFVHPRMRSVLSFTELDPSDTTVVLNPGCEADELEAIRRQFAAIVPVVMALGVTTCLLTLKTLNAFDFDEVRTPFMDEVNLDGMPAWEKIDALLHGPGESIH